MNDDKMNLKYNHLSKKMFIFLVIFGCIFIWTAKMLSISQLIITPLVVAIIPLYCFLSLRNKEFFIKEDQVGDNAYYMGFLFTLASLSHALFAFNNLSGNEINQIVGNFGVALWSTIAGIASRVYIAQLRQDIDEVEEDVKIKLLETSNRLTNELNQISFNLNNCARTLQNSIEESYQFANEKIQNNLIKISENFANKIAENIAKSNEIFNQFEDNCENINIHSKAVAKAFDKTVLKLENTVMPTDIIAKKVNEIFGEIEDNFDKSNKIIIAQNLINEETTKQSQILNQNFEKLSDNIKNNNKEFTELKTENYQLLVMSNNINKNIENLAILNNTQLEILNKNNQKLIENIVDLVNKIEQQNNINQIQINEQNSISKDSFIKNLSIIKS
jgi:hypothetical protein